MKTQILRLETYDDAVSIRDKLNRAKTRRVLLVWPVRRLRLRRLDFHLIQRHAHHLGLQIAVVCRDPIVQQEARAAGVPLFESVEAAHRQVWPRDRRRLRQRKGRRPRRTLADMTAWRATLPGAAFPWATRPGMRLTLFTLAVLAILAVVAMLLPHAEVHLVPLKRTEGVTVDVQAAPGIHSVSLTGAIPATWHTVEVEGRIEGTATGTLTVPATPARGRVTFTNLTAQAVDIPQGTVVSGGSPAVRFATGRPLHLEAGPGSQASVEVQALDWGPQGNLPAHTLNSVAGPLGLKVTVTNRTPTQGGTVTQVAAPTALDRSRLYSQLRHDLEQTALDELHATLDANDLLIRASLEPVAVVQRRYEPPTTQPAETLQLTLRMTFRALVVHGDDLRALAEGIRQTQMSPGYLPVANTLTWANQTEPTLTGETVRWRLHIRWQEVAALDEGRLVNGMLGATPAAAKEWLRENAPLAAPPTITLSPPWWPRLPLLPFRIRMVED